MANLNWLKTAKVKVPQRSGFDKSHRTLFTGKCGTLYPILCDEVIPNTRVHLKVASNIQMPPLVSDAFMNVQMKMEAFFVPFRLLYGGFESWLTGDKVFDTDTEAYEDVVIPVIRHYGSSFPGLGSGTLADFLGIRTVASTGSDSDQVEFFTNAFPFLAYHRVYDDWYRNTKIQRSLFTRRSVPSITGLVLTHLPFDSLSTHSSSYWLTLDDIFPDDYSLGQLRQRNFGSDYFTEAVASPQLGDSQSVEIGESDTFTISALRAANSIQQWLERRNLGGLRLQDYVLENYGASLSDGVAQRVLFLGSESFDVYTNGVEQSAEATNERNPFSSVGTRYGNAYASGDGVLIEDFTVNEPGFIFVMASLVPKVVYSSGVDKLHRCYNRQNSQTDMANPLLQNVGLEPIYSSELNGKDIYGTRANYVFGYIDRYSRFMTKEDSLHGILRDGESLQYFALQRHFDDAVEISSDFLEIPQNYLDQVMAANAGVSQFGYWADTYFNYYVSQPLAEFCQPSLQDPAYEHGNDVFVRRGGSRL